MIQVNLDEIGHVSFRLINTMGSNPSNLGLVVVLMC